MRYTVFAIVVIAAGLVTAVLMSGHARGGDLAMLVVAMLSVCVFGSIPVVLGVISKRKRSQTRRTTVVRRWDEGKPS